MRKSYLTQASANVAFMRCVIGPDGVAVPKDYDRRKLREGDIGYENRLDRNRVAELTPAQRVTAIRVIHETTDELLALLGEEPDEDWKVGTVVETVCEGETIRGFIRKVTKNSIVLSTITTETCRIVRRELPRRLTRADEIEVPGEFDGLEGLALLHLWPYLVGGYAHWKGSSSKLCQYLMSQEVIEFYFDHWFVRHPSYAGGRYSEYDTVILLGKKLENQTLRANLVLATRSIELLKTITDRVEIRRIAAATEPEFGDEFSDTVYELLSEEDQEQLVRFLLDARYGEKNIEKLGQNGFEAILDSDEHGEVHGYVACLVDPVRISSQYALYNFICATDDAVKKDVALERLTDQTLLCRAAMYHGRYDENSRRLLYETGMSILARVTDVVVLEAELKRMSTWPGHAEVRNVFYGRIRELETAAQGATAPATSG